MSAAPSRVAVTGLGALSPLGADLPASFAGLCRGERAFSPIESIDVSGLRTSMAAQVLGLRVEDIAPAGAGDTWSRSDAMAVVAAREALRDAGLGTRATGRLGLVVGGTTGGMFEAEGILATLGSRELDSPSARRLLAYPPSTSADRIATSIGSVHRVATVCSACSSSANAVVLGASWVREGMVDRALVGGTDGLCRLTLVGFSALGAIDPEPCRPFDATRAGLNLGEAAAFLLLESEAAARARGARVLAWLSGWSVRSEAHHITQPEPSGQRAGEILQAALAQAGLRAEEVDYVNAHGTATVSNDAMEARALARVFGERGGSVRISSAKGYVGHTLGAAGALEAAFTVRALVEGVFPPNVAPAQIEPELRARLVGPEAERGTLAVAASNSFGFGGTGTVLVFEGAERRARGQGRGGGGDGGRGLVLTGAAALSPAGLQVGEALGRTPARFSGDARHAPDPRPMLDPERSRRFDRASSFVTVGGRESLASARLAPAGVGVIAGTAFGTLERCVGFLTRVAEKGARFAAPAEFPHLVPSAPGGNASIYLGLDGPVLTVCDLATSAESAVMVACDLIDAGVASAMLAGSAEPTDGVVERVLGPLYGDESGADRSEGSAWVVVEAERGARERGAPVLARLVGRWELPRGDDPPPRTAPPPRRAERALVVVAGQDARLHRALASTGWSQVRRRQLQAEVGRHEGLGGFAVGVAAAAIGRGDVDEALACGSASGRTYLFHLARAVDAEPPGSRAPAGHGGASR